MVGARCQAKSKLPKHAARRLEVDHDKPDVVQPRDQADRVSALEARDPVWADAAMRSHIHAAKKVIFGVQSAVTMPRASP